jgi:hypothetical protein
MPNNNTTVSKIGFRVFSRGVFLPSASKEESTCQNPPGESIVGSTPNASFTKNGSNLKVAAVKKPIADFIEIEMYS